MTLKQLAILALKLPRPWLDGNVTAKEWIEAVDIIMKIAKG